MTLDGTNSYLVLGDGEAFAIDPGPADPEHISALLTAAATRDCRITAIAVTHGHRDHFPGAALLAAQTGAPVFAHAFARFAHDREARDGARIDVRGATLYAYETPGHAPDHLAFWFAPEAALFTGDVILGRGTVAIAPPEGDMRAYQATLRRLRDDFPHARIIYGGHGEPVVDPLAKIEHYIAHRQERENQIVTALARSDRTLAGLVTAVYRDVAPALRGPAEQQVLAYLAALEREGRVRVMGDAGLGPERYVLID
jgi:glyoxylase-like metal-dependent hydrolase (beta-lactamase superfamily II)